jgi:hypothetical protein
VAGHEVPVHADIPHQEVIFLDETDPISSPMKAKGVGELGICGIGCWAPPPLRPDMIFGRDNSEATSRGARMLRTALGPAIAAWLEDPAVVEVNASRTSFDTSGGHQRI